MANNLLDLISRIRNLFEQYPTPASFVQKRVIPQVQQRATQVLNTQVPQFTQVLTPPGLRNQPLPTWKQYLGIPSSGQQLAQGILENMPALIGTTPLPRVTGWSLPQAIGTTAGFAGLQRLAGYKKEDILNPVNLGLSLAMGGLRVGEPQPQPPLTKTYAFKIKPSIPKELQPLAQEARKSKSAEEFGRWFLRSNLGNKNKFWVQEIGSGGGREGITRPIQEYLDRLTDKELIKLFKGESVLNPHRTGYLYPQGIEGIRNLQDFYTQATTTIPTKGKTFEIAYWRDPIKGSGEIGPTVAKVEKIQTDSLNHAQDYANSVAKQQDWRVVYTNEIKPTPPQGVGGIPKELESLAQEARNYKSAEEFVNSQRKIIPIEKLEGKGTNLPVTHKEIERGLQETKQGIIKPIEIGRYPDGSLWVRDGSHRLSAMRAAGLKNIPIIDNPHNLNLTDFYTQVTKGIKEAPGVIRGLKEVITKPGIKAGIEIQKPLPEAVGRIVPTQKQPILPQPPKIKISPTQALKDILPQGVKERKFIKTVREAPTTAPEVAAKVKGFYEPITNRATVQEAQRVVNAGYDTAKQRVISEPLTAETNAIGQEIMRKSQVGGRFDEAIEMAETLATKGTTAGQSVQAFSIWSRLTPEGMLRYATKTVTKANEQMGAISKTIRQALGKQPTKIEAGDAKFITETMKKANQATTEEEKARLVKTAIETINKKIPWGVSDVIDEYRYANMLSNPLTHLRNTWSNLMQTYITRPMTLTAGGRPIEAVKYEIGAIKALPDAISKFAEAVKTPRGFGRLDEPMAMAQRRLGRWNLPPDLMEGADVFFRTLIEGGEKARGISPEEATKIAEYSLFRAGLKAEGQGYLLGKIDDITRATYGLRKVGLGWFIPFIRTPMNVAKQWIEYSPAGLATIPGSTAKRTQLAKTFLGSMATLLGAHWAMQGRVAWQAPTDPTEKELFYASGRKPFSVKIGDKWVPLMTFGVYAMALGIPTSIKYHFEESRTALSDDDLMKLIKVSMSSLNFWSQQTFVSGLGSFVKLMEGDQDYNLVRNITQPIDQLKPMAGFLRYLSTMVDPIFRKPGTLTEMLKSGVPFLTKDIPPYTEPFGEPSKRNIFQYITPYGVGIEKPEYEPMLQQRTQKLQENALLNKVTKEIEVNKGQQQAGNYFMYWNEKTATVKKIDLSFQPTPPILTGLAEIDKEARSRFNSEISKKANDIYDLYQLGKITVDEAETQMKALTELKAQYAKPKKAKKLAKVTLKLAKFQAPKVVGLKRAKLPTIKLKKAPTFKVTRPKPAMLRVAPVQIPKFNVPKIKGLTNAQILA